MPLSRSMSAYSEPSSASETTVCAALSGAMGIMPPRPNLVWSATMMTWLAASIELLLARSICSGKFQSGSRSGRGGGA